MRRVVANVNLAGLRAKGITMTTGEALAVAQSLFESGGDDACPPFGPLSRENIVLRQDGSVSSTACATTPTVLEAAVLVDELLPEGRALVPGALRYTLSRALHEVEAPPFDSLADFSRALRRFETGARTPIVRALYARAKDPPLIVESAWQSIVVPFAATVAAGIALIVAAEAVHIDRPARTPVVAATASRAIVARPIILNPPPTIVRVPAVSFAAKPTPRRHQAAVLRENQPPPRHPGFFSRVFSRVKIRVDEL